MSGRYGIVLLFAALCFSAGGWKLGQPVSGPVEKALAGVRGVRALVLPAAPSWLKNAADRLGKQRCRLVVVPGAGTNQALLVDEHGILRRKGAVPATAAQAVEFVREWDQGKVIFHNHCARCHGEDGQDTTYPYIRRLAGIGNRLSPAQIRERLHPTVVGPNYITVRGESFTARELEQLIVFLAGL